MGYCTIGEVDSIIAQALTSATDTSSQARRNLLQIGSVRNKNAIPNDIVEDYIRWSGQEIDATLSELYVTPICALADFESLIFSSIGEYNSYIVLEKDCPLASGDRIIIIFGDIEETHEIDEVLGDGLFSTVDPIQFAFPDGSRLIRIKFPDPLPWVCCRLAAANIYEKYLAAQVSTQETAYGKTLRSLGRQKLNDVLNGRAIIHGAHRIGRRLYDSTLVDQYGLPKGGESDKNIDSVGQ